MKVIRTRVYVGPNVYETEPVVRMAMDFSARRDLKLSSYPKSAAEELLDLLPELNNRTSADGRNVGELLLSGDCHLGDVMAWTALGLQRQAGAKAEIARYLPGEKDDEGDVLFGYLSRSTGVEAGELARQIILELIDPIPGKPFPIKDEIADYKDFASRRVLGPSGQALVEAADARGIPWLRLNDQSLIQLGHGKYQKRIEAALTSETSCISVDIAKDKEVSIQLLRDLGLPVPEQEYARSAKAAVDLAHDIGFPVVVKPVDGNHGRGVGINLRTDDEVREAFDIAAGQGSGVIVESMIEGEDHRILVIDGKLVAAAKRMPAHVVGDGRSTISELITEVNKDPRRGAGHENMLTRLELGKREIEVMGEAGHSPDSVPGEGEIVFLRKTANLSTGGTAIDVTDTIHPDNQRMAERAIKAVGLDIGGVDFLTTDITRSYRETGGAICEINAGPGIRMHIAPSEGEPRDVGGAVMDMLFPGDAPSAIPIAALTGTNGKTTTARMLSHVLKMAGSVVGQTSTDAVMIDGNVSMKGDMTGPVSARMVLRDPDVDMAVMETARGGIVRAGLGYRYCDVGAVLNVSSDHLGLGGVDTLDDLARVKRLVVEVARDTAVLNADNIYTLQMAAHTPAKNICYVTMNPNNKIVREHIKLGKRAFVLEEGANGQQIMLYDREVATPLIWTHLIPATLEGKARHNVENAMFAAAMAYALGLSLDQIRSGLRTFNNSFYQSPGRMNVFDEHGFRVILDYGHNEAAISSMVDLVSQLDTRGKRIVCATCPGDRRDEDIRAIGEAIAGKFDTYLLHTDDDLRGREKGAIQEIMAEELRKHGVSPDAIHIMDSEEQSVSEGLQRAERDDLVLMFCGGITRAWKQITKFESPHRHTEEGDTVAQKNLAAEIDVPDGYTIVSDERGVRLAPLS
ncbi:cyanophycin synthetase [Parvularcula sp. ZS-1/3]|uniref:Cyanophycin synthetase n=1 Tax=Parvularcula mediterranea TaxID=2732508 RepID=A0A7Y3W3S7_9PROT|nr:cyanophycin synthetase [Parvularcula mediterranea]NNU14768.1 cyanophycin synthetase [Parvularcula mediterranea]